MDNEIVTYSHGSALSKQIKTFFLTGTDDSSKEIEPYEKPIPVLQDGHSSTVTCLLSININGSYFLISGSNTGLLINFDMKTGFVVFNIHITQPLSHIVYCESSNTLVIGGENGSVILINALHGRRIKTFTPDGKSVTGLAVDELLKVIFITTFTGTLFIYSFNGDLLKKINTGKNINNCMTYCPNTKTVFIGTQNSKVIKLTISDDLKFSKTIIISYKQKRSITGILLVPESNSILVCLLNGMVYLEDIEHESTLLSFITESQITDNLFIFGVLFTLHKDGKIRLYSVESNKAFFLKIIDSIPFSCISKGSKEGQILIGIDDNYPGPSVMDYNTLKIIRKYSGYPGNVSRLFPGLNEFSFFTYSDDNILREWDIRNCSPLKMFSGHKSSINAINFTQNLFTVSGTGLYEGKIICYNNKTTKILNIYSKGGLSYKSCDFSTFHGEIFVSTDSGDIISLSVTGEINNEWHISDSEIFLFTGNNKSIFTVSENTIIEWQIKKQKKLEKIFTKKINFKNKIKSIAKNRNKNVLIFTEHTVVIFDYKSRSVTKEIEIIPVINNCSIYDDKIIIVTSNVIFFLSMEGIILFRIDDKNCQFNDCIVLNNKIIIISTYNGIRLYNLSLEHFLSIKLISQNHFALFTPDKTCFYVTDDSLIEFYTEKNQLFEGKGFDLVTDKREKKRKQIRFIDEFEIMGILKKYLE